MGVVSRRGQTAWRLEQQVVLGESRMRSYKTRGLDLEEVRRRKEEEGLQLRKSKREEQVS